MRINGLPFYYLPLSGVVGGLTGTSIKICDQFYCNQNEDNDKDLIVTGRADRFNSQYRHLEIRQK